MNSAPIAPILAIPTQADGEDLVRLINARMRDISIALDELRPKPAVRLGPGAPPVSISIADTHSVRSAANPNAYELGAIFFETDRHLLYQLQGSTTRVWVYMAGVMADTLANKPTGLGTTDKGLLVEATDYKRVFRWTGSAWERAPGERPTREFCYFAENPGTGWHLCDGSASITYTKADATTGTMTLPDERGYYRKGGTSYTGTGNAATTPSITGTTASESSHTHSVLATGVNVAAGANAINNVTGATTGGSAHSHSAGTLALSSAAEPPNVVMLPYMKL